MSTEYSTPTVSRPPLVLDRPRDWEPWLETVRSMASGEDRYAWEYINPNSETTPEKRQKPTKPTFKSINPEADSPSKLSANEMELLRLQHFDYQIEYKEYQETSRLINSVQEYIFKSVSIRNRVYLQDQATVYDMLVALKKRLAPTDYATKLDLSAEYAKLRKYNKGESIEQFLQKWETTYGKAVKLNLSEVQGDKPLLDFVQAIKPIEPNFSATQDYHLTKDIRNKSPLPTLYDLVADFRDTYRRNIAASGYSKTHASFATFQNQEQPGNPPKDETAKSKKTPKPKCLCGFTHKQEQCWYLNPSKRPTDWKPNPERIDQLNKLLDHPDQSKTKEQWIQKGYDLANNQGSITTPAPTSSPTPERTLAAYTASFAGVHAPSSQTGIYRLVNCWTLDGASDIHLCNDRKRSQFKKTRDAHDSDRLTSGKTTYPIEAWGTVILNIDTPKGPDQIRLLNVALVPGYMTNLVAMDIINEKGLHWSSRRPLELHQNTGETMCYLKKIDRHLVIDQTTEIEHLSFATSTQSPIARLTKQELHSALGHPGPQVIDHIPNSVENLIVLDPESPTPKTIDCGDCSVSKAHKVISRRTEVDDRSNGKPFDRMAWDLIQEDVGYNGHRWVSHFCCLDHRYHLVFTHHSKSDSFAFMVQVIIWVKAQFGYDVRFIRLDGETALGTEFAVFVNSKGIKQERTAPDSPEQNGGSERAGGILTQIARVIIISARIPFNLWPEAYQMAAYLANRRPILALSWKTPFESVKGYKPRLGHLHPFGCKAYALIKGIPRSQKMRPRAHVGYFMGYSSTNIFRIWVPSLEKVVRTRDATFDHKSFYQPGDIDLGFVLRQEEEVIESLQLPDDMIAEGEVDVDSDTIIVDVPFLPAETATLSTPEDQPANQEAENTITQQPTAENKQANDQAAHYPTPEATPDPISFPTLPPANPSPDSTIEATYNEGTAPQSMDSSSTGQNTVPNSTGNSSARRNEISSHLDEENIIQGPRSRRRRNVYATALLNTHHLSGYNMAFGAAYSLASTQIRPHHTQLEKEPKGWHQMIRHPNATEFRKAADTEFNTLKTMEAFEFVPKQNYQVQEPLPLTWVFKYKLNTDRFLTKYKARLCARGDLQKLEHWQETYAATLAAQTFRFMMALVAGFGLETRQYDAVNAFINSKLEPPLLCKCPEGYEAPGKLLLLHKALYGLKESPLLWYRELTSTLIQLGLYPVPGVNCLYSSSWLTLFFYVDDIIAIFAPKDAVKMDQFEAKLMAKYHLRLLGEANHFLGIRILRERSTKKLWLVQDSYIQGMSSKFNVNINAKAPSTPLPTGELGPYTGQATPQQIFAYQQKVGSINYASVITRADVAKAISRLAEFQLNPGPKHIAAADHLLQYLEGSKGLAIEFNGNATQSKELFSAWSDAAYGDNPTTRYSSNGFCFKLFGGVIHYKATKQKTVTTSSTEAELLAISLAAKELIWWNRLFKAIQFDLQDDQSQTLYCDNQQTIRFLTVDIPRLETKLKHIDIHQCWLRQEVLSGSIKVEWVPTAKMVADGFTKSLPAQKHAEFVRQLNMVDISNKLDSRDKPN
ncbi:uncharacterized protein BP5553_05804 [Venustampulla echinocandica]|uniref:Integrase catalytic domain-containing protein n=1 Tax=Venustampulla echinocandica TaxID=2656787 RepID=A0A370TLP4_9HELO|nr:uncharacterized protein BP5553_05804 [Venustampulla echinocandica]RDL36452.1 hypothetical protein BP5553_05804 [Venustampulla echinocandica]